MGLISLFGWEFNQILLTLTLTPNPYANSSKVICSGIPNHEANYSFHTGHLISMFAMITQTRQQV